MADYTHSHGYNLGLEMTKCYAGYFDHHETHSNELITTMKLKNIELKVMSDLTNKLTQAKLSKKPLDINGDEIAKKLAYLVHLSNPSILENVIHNTPIEESNLHQRLTEIHQRLHKDGVCDANIDLDLILAHINVDNIRVDSLSEDAIDVIIQGVDSETKMITTDLNENMMYINRNYDDRSQMTEQARQILKEADELNKSIISKTARQR